jgi:hypothetical protein
MPVKAGINVPKSTEDGVQKERSGHGGVGRLEEHHIYFRIILHIADYFHSLLYN